MASHDGKAVLACQKRLCILISSPLLVIINELIDMVGRVIRVCINDCTSAVQVPQSNVT